MIKQQKTGAKPKTPFTAQQAAALASMFLVIGGTIAGYFAPVAHANYDAQISSLERQIKALENEKRQYDTKANELRIYASTLQGELAALEADRTAIQTQIDALTDNINKLRAEIASTQKKIDNNREALGELMIEIYLASQISPLERLASSKTLTAFLDEEVVRENQQLELNRRVKEIRSFKQKLEEQEKQLKHSLQIQDEKKADLLAKEAAKQKLIDETKGDEASYGRLAAANNERISKLQAEQSELIRLKYQAAGVITGGASGTGGYPWAHVSYPCWSDACVDPWGLYMRECVSYTAWKVASSGRYMPNFGGRGNARQWPSTAAAFGIPSGYTPRAGSVAVWYIGVHGHVMYVEQVHADRITVSDYNRGYPSNPGRYDRYDLPLSFTRANGFVYIYF